MFHILKIWATLAKIFSARHDIEQNVEKENTQ